MRRETGLSVGLRSDVRRRLLTADTLRKSAVLFIEPLEATIFERWEVKGRNDYTPEEVQSLRDYLEHGGFVYMLAHGSASRTLIGAKRLVQRILPDAPLTPIPADHPIYRSYFQLDGPLAYPYRRGFHEDEKITWLGVTLRGRLAIVVDTEETLHVVDQWVKSGDQSHVYSQLAPAAAARLINVIVYASAQ